MTPMPPLLDPTRIQQVSPAVSPTGTPVLAPKLIPALLALGSLAVAAITYAPDNTIIHKAGVAIVGILGLFGLASPGLRR